MSHRHEPSRRRRPRGGHGRRSIRWGHRNGKVVMPTKYFLVVTETLARACQKGEAIAVADVERSVCFRVVTILEKFGEGDQSP